jgi:hypothetical protein
MKWLIAAGLMVLPLAALLVTHLSQPQTAPRLPHQITGGPPASPPLGELSTSDTVAAK